MSGRAAGTPKSRDGLVEAIRAVEVVCHGAIRDRTQTINQFKALLITAPMSLRERLAEERLSRQLELARRFRDHRCPVESQTRFALKHLAVKIRFLDE